MPERDWPVHSLKEQKIMKFTSEGKAAIDKILQCMREADAAFRSLNADENEACWEFHAEGCSLNHTTRWGLTAAEEIHAALLEQVKPLQNG